MSIFFKIRELFTPKVIFVWQSELSHPTECKRYKSDELENYEIVILKAIWNQNGIKASELDRHYSSGGRRANDLLHKGYCENAGTKKIMKYVLSEKGFNFLKKI